MEKHNLKPVAVPTDIIGGLTGARIGMAKGDRVAFVCQMGDSTGATVQLSLQQHDAASAGNSKALSIDNPYYHKVAAATVFTKVVPGAAASTFDVSALFANDEGLVVFEVLGEQLDVDGGYAWVSLNAAAAGVAKILAAVYVQSDCRQLPAYSEAL